MNIIKCNNYIFSSSKAMFKLRGVRCIRGGGVAAGCQKRRKAIN